MRSLTQHLDREDFFEENARDPVIYKEDWSTIERHSLRFCDRRPFPREPFERLFSIRFEKFGSIAYPRPENPTVLFPYNFLFHDEIPFDGSTLEAAIEESVNAQLGKQKILFVTCPREFYLIQFETFSADIVRMPITGRAMDAFVVTDWDFKRCFVFDEDLNVTFAVDLLSEGDRVCGFDKPEMDRYFSEKFEPENPNNQRHIDIINRYFVANCPGVAPVEATGKWVP